MRIAHLPRLLQVLVIIVVADMFCWITIDFDHDVTDDAPALDIAPPRPRFEQSLPPTYQNACERPLRGRSEPTVSNDGCDNIADLYHDMRSHRHVPSTGWNLSDVQTMLVRIQDTLKSLQ